MRKSIALLFVALIASSGAGHAAPACHNGSYRTVGGDLIVISGPTLDALRYTFPDGHAGLLRRTDTQETLLVPGWKSDGKPSGRAVLGECNAAAIELAPDNGPLHRWGRMPLRITETQFDSAGFKLKGRLVTPAAGNWPLVVLVHGSEQAPAIDVYTWQYLLPARGIGVFVFDKRGTGGSQGAYTQNFDVLAADVTAAVAEARRLAAHATGVGLLGGSQGGWVAPLAATQARVDFLIVAFGLLVPVLEEDKLQVVNDLRRAGYDNAVQRQAAEVADATAEIMLSGFKSGYARLEALKRRFGKEPWFAHLGGEYTGEMVKFTERELRREGPARYDNLGVPWYYQPLEATRSLAIPQLWILAQDDIEAPSGETIALLQRLQSEGRPIDVAMFPNTDHGIVEFDEAPDLTRMRRKYAAGFFDMPSDWIHGSMIGRSYGAARITLHGMR